MTKIIRLDVVNGQELAASIVAALTELYKDSGRFQYSDAGGRDYTIEFIPSIVPFVADGFFQELVGFVMGFAKASQRF